VGKVFVWPSRVELEKSHKSRPSATVLGTIDRYDADAQDDEGALHQILILRVKEVLAASDGVSIEVADLLYVAIRYGDAAGIPAEIPGIEPGKEIEVRGAFVPPEEAYPQPDGRQLGVLHFTHRPFGWVRYQGELYQ
jgi:hypothetical protein